MSDVTREAPRPPDGGWGWFVVLATFTSCFLSSGSYYSFGVFFVAFLKKYNQSKALTAMVGAFCSLFFVVTTSYGLVLARKIGHRKTVMLGGVITFVGTFATAFATQVWHLYITFGVIIGSGLGIPFVVCIEMIGKYFSKRFSIAIGLALAGTGAGQFALSVLAQYLLDEYGLRGTIIIFSALYTHLCVAGALLRPLENKRKPPSAAYQISTATEAGAHHDEASENLNVELQEQSVVRVERDNADLENGALRSGQSGSPAPINQDRKKKSFVLLLLTTLYDFSLCKEPVFLLIMVIAVGQMCGQTAISTHLVKRARDFGIGGMESAYLPAAMGLTQVVGRPIFGAIGNIRKLNPSFPFGVCMAICGLSLTVSSYTPSFAAQIVFVIVYGVFFGGYTVLNSVVVAYYMGKPRLGYGVSFILHIHGISGLFLGPLTGWMRDDSGNYEGAFWLVGSAMMCSGVIALLLPLVNRLVKRSRRKR